MTLNHILYRDFGMRVGERYTIYETYGGLVADNVEMRITKHGNDTKIILCYANTGATLNNYNQILAMLDSQYYYAKKILG